MTMQTSSDNIPASYTPPGDGGMGLSDIVATIWAYRWSFIIPVFILGLLGLIIAGSTYLRSGVNHFTYIVKFNFSGVQELKYPNGESFSTQDIIAPNIVEQVYSNLIEGQHDVPPQAFREAFSISAYSPSRQFIIQKYRDIANNRRITVAETTRAQTALEEELRTAQRGAARIRFDNRRVNLPAPVVAASLEKLVQTWNEYSVAKRGVLELDIDVLDPNYFVEESLAGVGQINTLTGLIAMQKKIKIYVQKLSELEGAGGQRDAESGTSLGTLTTRLDFIEGRVIDFSRAWSARDSLKGVAMEDLLSSAGFSEEPLKGLDPQIAYDLLLGRIQDIRSNITKIRSTKSGASIIDPTTKLTVVDLENILRELEIFKIKPVRDAVLQSGFSKDPERVRAYYEQRIRDIERTKQSFEALAGVIESVDARYEKAGSPSASANGAASGLNSGTTVIPQFDDGFLDRIIEMSSKSDDTKFRQELARRSISLLEQVATLQSTINGLKSDLVIFDRGVANPRSRTGNDIPADAEVSAILTELKSYLEVTVRIGQRIANVVELTSVLQSGLGLEETDGRLSRVSFMRSDDVPDIGLEDILKPMRSIVETANRLNADLSTALFGSRNLASSIAEPRQLSPRLLNRRRILIVLVFGMLGVLLGTLLVTWKFLMNGRRATV